MLKFGLTLMCVATLVGCQKSPPQMKKPPQKITLAHATLAHCALVYIAMAKGYFTEEGLDVQPQIHTYGKSALDSVLAGKADLATVAETPVMFAVLKGEKIFIVANISNSNKDVAVIARRDNGISVPGDLMGKRIGYTPGTSGEFFMDSFFAANGIVRKDVNPIGLKPEEMVDALVTGKIDAAATWNLPLILLRKKLGDKGVTFFDKGIYTETFNITAQQEFVQKNPETIKRLLRGLIKAEKFAAASPDEAQILVATALTIDKSLMAEIWNDFDYRVNLSQTLLIALEDETRWAMSNHLVDQTKMPNYISYIHVESLKAVKPESVRIIR